MAMLRAELNVKEIVLIDDESALVEWAKCVTGQSWNEAYVFFKHDETENGGSGPPAVATFVTAGGS